MNLRRFYLCLLLSLSLCFVTAFSSYAAIASASDALSSSASASEASSMLLSDDVDHGIMPLSSVGTVTNTVDRSSIGIYYSFIDADGVRHVQYSYVNPDGTFHLNFNGYLSSVIFLFSSVSLPSAGNYYFSADLSSDFSCTYSGVFLRFLLFNKNATNTESLVSIESHTSQSSGDLYVSPLVVSLGSYTSQSQPFQLRLSFDSTATVSNVFSGSVRFNFTKSTGDSVDVAAPGSSSGDVTADYQSGVTSSLGSIGDTLEEIVETISMQLDALWNQLYNYMHLPQMEKLEAIRQAIENIRLDVDVDNQDVVNKLDEQIQNDNANTQRVEQAVEKHGNFIIEGLKSLFIPDEEYFSSLFDRLHQFFSDRLGFLYVPFDLLIRLLDAIKNADTAFAGIPFPGIQAGEWVLLEPTTVTFDILNEFPELVQALHFITSVVMIGAFLNLLHRKMEEVMAR